MFFACILVEVQVRGKLPDMVDFVKEKDVIMLPEVKYEWKPVKCYNLGTRMRIIGEKWYG